MTFFQSAIDILDGIWTFICNIADGVANFVSNVPSFVSYLGACISSFPGFVSVPLGVALTFLVFRSVAKYM